MTRQYIGARYVPRFVGNYDVTQSYEALDVVDNGSGTSYISKIPTPAGTPLTDTNHWFLYGSTSGAIVNLQDQINDMKDITKSGSLQNQIGDLADLDTSDKDNLVDAINEHDSEIQTLANNKADNDDLQKYTHNVIQLGVIADGTTDNAATINALLATHKALYFPSGTYVINDTINISEDDVEIWGDNDTFIITTNSTDFNMFYVTGNNTHIHDLNISGIFDHTRLLYFDGAIKPHVHDLALSECENGMQFKNSTKEGYINNFEIRQFNNYGIEVESCNDLFFNTFYLINEWRQGYGVPHSTSIYVHKKAESIDFANADVVGGQRTLYISADGGSAASRTIPEFLRFTNVYFDTSKLDNIIDSCTMLRFTQCWWSYTGQNFQASEITEGSAVGLHLVRCTNCTFVSCDFTSNGDSGIIDENGEGNKYIGCFIGNNNRYNRLSHKYGCGMAIIANSKNISIIGCIAISDDSVYGHQLDAFSVEDNATEINISDCTINNVANNTVHNINYTTNGFIDFNNQLATTPNFNKAALATINTRNASYVAPRNVIISGTLEGDSDGTATLAVDSIIVMRAKDGIATTQQFVVKKGQTVTTRATGGIYDFGVYELASTPI